MRFRLWSLLEDNYDVFYWVSSFVSVGNYHECIVYIWRFRGMMLNRGKQKQSSWLSAKIHKQHKIVHSSITSRQLADCWKLGSTDFRWRRALRPGTPCRVDCQVWFCCSVLSTHNIAHIIWKRINQNEERTRMDSMNLSHVDYPSHKTV